MTFTAFNVKQYSESQAAPAENKTHLKCVQYTSVLKSLIEPFPEFILGKRLLFNRSHPALQYQETETREKTQRRITDSQLDPRPATASPARPLPQAGPGFAGQPPSTHEESGRPRPAPVRCASTLPFLPEKRRRATPVWRRQPVPPRSGSRSSKTPRPTSSDCVRAACVTLRRHGCAGC